MDYQRILLMLGLAVTAYLMILAWNKDYGNPGTQPTITTNNQPQVIVPTNNDNANEIVPTMVDTNVVSEVPRKYQVEKTAVKTSEKGSDGYRVIQVHTDVFELTINLLGGDIVIGALPQYPASLVTPAIPFLLLDPANHYSAQSGLIGPDGIDTVKERPLYQSEAFAYSLDDADELMVDLMFEPTENVSITKRFIFTRGDYLIQVEYWVNNRSEQIWQTALFAQIKRDGQNPVGFDAPGMGLQPYVGGATFKPGEPYSKLPFDDIAEDSYQMEVESGYMAMVQHYFLSAWIPSDVKPHVYRARKLPDQDIYLLGFTGPLLEVAPGGQDQLGAQFYLGPKDQYRLEEITQGLNLTVDYGFLWWLSQLLFDLLTVTYSVVNNYGLAIIILTIIVKLLLYPLSAASFKSMAKMRKLQPEMMRLKERYADNKQKFSQAMMELYKKEGANPLGGCLPLVLQMPVFLALYWTLMESVELRQAPFFLWIHDLSVMDPYFVLPILMGISMYITQSLQPELPDPMQAKVMKFMPIMFTFFFLWFPSGLVLYWLVNNLLSILQQWYVTRQIEKGT